MLLQLRRQGIRNFPNGERVALFSNPQLGIQLAVPYDSITGALKPTNALPIREHNEGKSESREEMIVCLQHAYKATLVPQPTELQKALHNWLHSELQEYGDWSDMPENVLYDVHDDFDALVKGSSLEKELLGEQNLDERRVPIRKINNYPDWHEQMERKGEVQFKIHDAGNKTSGYLNGKHLGTFNHQTKSGEILEDKQLRPIDTDKQSLLEVSEFQHKDIEFRKIKNNDDHRNKWEVKYKGNHVGHMYSGDTIGHLRGIGRISGGKTHQTHYTYESLQGFKSSKTWNKEDLSHLIANHHDSLKEEVLNESPLHRINTILRTGQEDHVTFHNGASARVHPNTARVVHQLYHKVNSHNRAKLSELINSSPEGLVRVAKFADELGKKNTEAK